MPEPSTAARSSSLPTIAAVLLAAALVGAGAYIAQLRGQIAALQGELVAQKAQLQPFADAAKAAYPDADSAAALASVTQRLGELMRSSAAQPSDFMPADKQQAMLEVLRNQTDGQRKAWILAAQNNAEAVGAQLALQKLFEQAGWPVLTARTPYPLKAGVLVLAGDETPPAYVDSVSEALGAGGIESQYLTGYRGFVADRKAQNPKWVGPELEDDQPYVIVIGSRPKPKAPDTTAE
ncbi:MAG: hypothetical protein ABI629_23235 [bacterium]